MHKRILVAVDDSMNSKHALHYVGRTFAGRPEPAFELLHVQPILSEYLIEEARKDPKAFQRLEKAMARNMEKSRRMLEACKERMVRDGVSEERITLSSQPRRIGLAKDILDYGREGMFDSLVAGRRGLSRLQKVFMGSTSLKLIEHTDFLPVWVVDRERAVEKILVPVDGSKASLRLVELLGFLFPEREDIVFTLYHATPTGPEVAPESFLDEEDLGEMLSELETRWVTRVLSDAVGMLTDAGIPLKKIHIRTEKTDGRPGKAILEMVESGGFDTVVMGRRGSGRAFFFGSVSRYVAERLQGRALWLVP
ncbi:MAG: universal stress protein [Desulfobacteraceae bacterium]|nr:universal stress protein [Desulfobacteraceae bacterium]